jgi:hypothetical protein
MRIFPPSIPIRRIAHGACSAAFALAVIAMPVRKAR